MKRKTWFIDYKKATKKEVLSLIGSKEVKEMEDYVDNNGWEDYSSRCYDDKTVVCRP